MRRILGFSMIEVLLVVTVLALVAGLGVMTLRHQEDRSQVDQTALEMQGVLQAALAYNVNQQEWPAAYGSIKSTDPAACDEKAPGEPNKSFIDTYLPNKSYTSNYGATFCWSAGKVQDDKVDLHAPLFWVAVKVPGKGAEMLNYANRLTARLPSAVAVTDPTAADPSACTADSPQCWVRSEVAQPGAGSSEESGTHVMGVGSCNPLVGNDPSDPCSGVTQFNQAGSQSSLSCSYVQNTGPDYFQYHVKFSCPVGEVGYVTATPAHWFLGTIVKNVGGSLSPDLNRMYVQGAQPIKCADDPSTSNGFDCTVNVYAYAYDEANDLFSINHNTTRKMAYTAGCVGADYTAVCVKPEKK